MIRRWSRHSRHSVPIQRSTMAFARGARTGVGMMRMSVPANTASKAAVNLLSRSRIKKPEPVASVAEANEQVAGLLGKPGAGGMSGDAGDVHAAAAVLDHHQDVEATQEDGVDVGEVDGEDRLGLGGEELLPGWPDRFGPESMPADFRIFIASGGGAGSETCGGGTPSSSISTACLPDPGNCPTSGPPPPRQLAGKDHDEDDQ